MVSILLKIVSVLTTRKDDILNTGYLLMNISKQLKYSLNQELKKRGLTVQQWAIIQQLSHLDEATSVELTKTLDMDKPTISGIIQRLEKKGLLQKKENFMDKRSYLISLTPLGYKKHKEGQVVSDHLIENYLAALSSEEQQTLKTLLIKINQEH